MGSAYHPIVSRTRALGLASSITFIVGLFVVLPRLGAEEKKKDGKENLYKPLGLFTEVLSLVRTNYVEEVDVKPLMAGAFSGMTEAMDPFAEYIPADQVSLFKAAEEARRKEGMVEPGVVLARRFGYPVVVAAVPGSPAAKAGLKPDDLIEKVDGKPARPLSLWQVETRLAGKPGGRVSLTVVREGKPRYRTFDIIRSSWEPEKPSITRVGGESVLRIPWIGAGATASVKEVLSPLDPSKALVIDVRGVAGGSFEEAARLASLFVPAGPIGEMKGRKVEGQRFATQSQGRVHSGRLAILIDSGTAGAAEFFAAAVRESAGRLKGAPSPTPSPAASPTPVPTGVVAEKKPEPKTRVRLIGEPTTGMGADYQVVNLPSGGALKLAVAKLKTAGGVSLSPKGLEPDDRVFTVAHQETTGPETDQALQQGLRFLAEGATPPAS